MTVLLYVALLLWVLIDGMRNIQNDGNLWRAVMIYLGEFVGVTVLVYLPLRIATLSFFVGIVLALTAMNAYGVWKDWGVEVVDDEI